MYEHQGYCNETGYGPKWNFQKWGTFADDLNVDGNGRTARVCPQCGCGKKELDSGTPSFHGFMVSWFQV